MRRARPSTMAVLPTPGSPMSTGLFLVRRDSTWMTRRISSSRPITGSSLPWRATSVRSRPYFSSAWNWPSGFWEVTRCVPRTFCRAPSTRLAVDADAVGHGQQQVLGGDVLVAQLLAGGVGRVDDAAQLARTGGPRCRRRGAAWPGLGHLVAQGDEVDAQVGQHGQHDALGLAQQGRQEVVGGDLGVAGGRWRPRGRPCTASCVLLVQRLGSNAMGPRSSRRGSIPVPQRT